MGSGLPRALICWFVRGGRAPGGIGLGARYTLGAIPALRGGAPGRAARLGGYTHSRCRIPVLSGRTLGSREHALSGRGPVHGAAWPMAIAGFVAGFAAAGPATHIAWTMVAATTVATAPAGHLAPMSVKVRATGTADHRARPSRTTAAVVEGAGRARSGAPYAIAAIEAVARSTADLAPNAGDAVKPGAAGTVSVAAWYKLDTHAIDPTGSGRALDDHDAGLGHAPGAVPPRAGRADYFGIIIGFNIVGGTTADGQKQKARRNRQRYPNAL